MSADDEVLRRIQAGDVAAYAELITDAAAKVAAGRLPHPEGRRWTDDDVDDLVVDFYDSPGYEHALLSAVDDEALRRLVYTSLANLVRDRLRRSDRGRLLRRMKEIMRSGAFVERPARFWCRAGDTGEPFPGHPDGLLTAAWSVEVTVVRWRPDAKRNSPVAERASFVAVLDAIFDIAAGPVHEDVLVDVVGRRLGVGPVSYVEPLDAADESHRADAQDPTPEELVVAGDEELEAATEAAHVWSQLSPDEQARMGCFDLADRPAAEALGWGKSKANAVYRRLTAKLRALIGEVDTDRRAAVVRELRSLAGTPDT